MGYSLHHPKLGITAEVLARTLVSAAQLKLMANPALIYL